MYIVMDESQMSEMDESQMSEMYENDVKKFLKFAT